MSYAPYPSGTLLIPSGPGDKKHLFIIVTNICCDEQHLLFSISSVKPKVVYDDACVFVGGEHEFITGESYVYYRRPDRRRADNISRLVDKKYFDVKSDLEQGHFAKVCEGVEKSKFTKPSTLKYFLENCP